MQAGVKNTRTWIGVLAGLAIVAAALCFVRLTTNPRGFYIDESSIAYNAHLIAQTGCDETGIRWPLYFRAFGDYKNPVYIYTLASVFRLTGPNILAARLLSAIFVALAAGILGGALLGRRAEHPDRARQLAQHVSFKTLRRPEQYDPMPGLDAQLLGQRSA